MSSSNNSIMVSDTGENDLRVQPTALTANISALPPPSSGATTTFTPTAESLLSSSSPSLSPPLSSTPLSVPSPSTLSLLTDGNSSLPVLQSPATLAATISLINHLLHNLNLNPKDIATLLTNSPPLSAISPTLAAGSATLMAGHSNSLPHPTLAHPYLNSAHDIWTHLSPRSGPSTLADTSFLPHSNITPTLNPNSSISDRAAAPNHTPNPSLLHANPSPLYSYSAAAPNHEPNPNPNNNFNPATSSFFYSPAAATPLLGGAAPTPPTLSLPNPTLSFPSSSLPSPSMISIDKKTEDTSLLPDFSLP